MRRLIKNTACLLLVLLIFVSSSATIFAYTTDGMVKAALEFIYANEGYYNSVLANDNGAVSIGKIGWHGPRALQLLRMIAQANPNQAKQILGTSFYNEIMTASDVSWNTRSLSASEKSAVEKLLSTDESKQAQDKLSYDNIKGYITHAQGLGITDPKTLVYFADLENQLGAYGAERVLKSASGTAGSASKVTLAVLYNAAMADRTAGSSPTRRKTAYEYCQSLNFDGSGETNTSYKTGQYRISTASDPLRIRKNAGTSYATVGSVPKGTVVTVTQISGVWGKIAYGGVTGWISLSYATYIGSASASPKGDINGNGTTDSGDARLALRHSAHLTELTATQKKIADLDGDGNITAKDARSILRIAAKIDF